MQVKEVIKIMEKIVLGELEKIHDAGYDEKNLPIHKSCIERNDGIECGGPMISCPAIPDYYGKDRRQLICRNHIHNFWGALAWYEHENNLERNFDDKEIAFTKKEEVKR